MYNVLPWAMNISEYLSSRLKYRSGGRTCGISNGGGERMPSGAPTDCQGRGYFGEQSSSRDQSQDWKTANSSRDGGDHIQRPSAARSSKLLPSLLAPITESPTPAEVGMLNENMCTPAYRTAPFLSRLSSPTICPRTVALIYSPCISIAVQGLTL